ncbi:hypothetical protein RYX36_028957 [Vicia faba]
MCYYNPDAAKLGGAIMAGEGSTSAPSECFWWQVGVEEWHGLQEKESQRSEKHTILDRKTKANEAEPRVIGWFSPGESRGNQLGRLCQWIVSDLVSTNYLLVLRIRKKVLYLRHRLNRYGLEELESLKAIPDRFPFVSAKMDEKKDKNWFTRSRDTRPSFNYDLSSLES